MTDTPFRALIRMPNPTAAIPARACHTALRVGEVPISERAGRLRELRSSL